MTSSNTHRRRIAVDPVSAGTTLNLLRTGSMDPTVSSDDTGFWRVTLTPLGPSGVHMSRDGDAHVDASSLGPGASWSADHCEHLLGLHDQPTIVTALHDAVRRAQRNHGHLRLPTTLTPYHDLLPAVIAQRVTGREAAMQWREMCLRYGQTVPGAPEHLRTPPTPRRLLEIPYYELHRIGIERSRASILHRVARHFLDHPICIAVHSLTDRSSLTASLSVIRGVGPWTAAVAGLTAFGDADALAVGDFHHKNTVTFALTGAHRGTDVEMERLFEPYRPERARVLLWLQRDGWSAPAHGPRRRIVDVASL